MPQSIRDKYYEDEEARPDLEVASAARGTSGNGTAFQVENIETVIGRLVVSAVTGGTPTLDVRMEVSFDAGQTFEQTSDPAFGQKTGTTTGDYESFDVAGADQARWAWTIGGSTPSFTFTINDVKVVYK